jgi:hypothetical protein
MKNSENKDFFLLPIHHGKTYAIAIEKNMPVYVEDLLSSVGIS